MFNPEDFFKDFLSLLKKDFFESKSSKLKVETTYSKATKVTKKYLSEDGTVVAQEVKYLDGDVDEKEQRIQELLKEKEAAIEKEDYERCMEIKKELEELNKE